MSKLPTHRAAAPKMHDKLSFGSKKLLLVEIIRPYGFYPVGHRFRPPGTLRDVMMDRKVIRLVDEKAEEQAKKAPAKKTRKPAVKKIAPKKAAE